MQELKNRKVEAEGRGETGMFAPEETPNHGNPLKAAADACQISTFLRTLTLNGQAR